MEENIIDKILSVSDFYKREELENMDDDSLNEIFEGLSNEYFNHENDEENEYLNVVDEELVINISDLSKADQRHYAKTGQLSKNTLKKLN